MCREQFFQIKRVQYDINAGRWLRDSSLLKDGEVEAHYDAEDCNRRVKQRVNFVSCAFPED